MDNQRNLHSWAYYYQGKSMDELKYSLLYTTLELETTRIAAQEEIRRREDQVIHLKDMLDRVIRERDEAQNKCQKLLMDKHLLLLQHHQPQQRQTTLISGISSSIEDEPIRGDSNTGLSSSDCEESIVSSPVVDPIPLIPPPTSPPTLQIALEKPLPEKGKFLQAVMNAGPLLQTLLLAGPLPQWQHPPPPLESYEIPPVIIPSPSPSPPHILHQVATTINIKGSFTKRKRPVMV